MNEAKVDKWVKELVMTRTMSGRRLFYLPKTFYSDLTDDEQREVMIRYKEAAKTAFWNK